MKPKKFKGYSIEGKNGTVYAYEMICYQETAFEIKRDKKNLEMLVYVDYSYPVAVDVELILKAIEYAKEYFNKQWRMRNDT